MTDIANIGFKVDTSELKAGKAALESIVPSAAKVQRASENVEKATLSAATTAARAANQQAKAVLAAAMASDTATRADIKAAQQTVRKTSAVLASARAAETQASASRASAAATMAQAQAAEHATAKVNQLAAANMNAGRTAGQVQADFTNLASQFQDIGVTAAMGMSPLQIGLQQGAQISAVLGPLGAAGAVRALGASFLAVIGPVSLTIIALTALLAAGLQTVDWAGLAKDALNALADVLPVVAKYAAIAAAGLALMYAPAILAGIASLPGLIAAGTRAVIAFGSAVAATAGLPLLIVAAFVTVIAALEYFREDVTQILGFDLLGVIKDVVNYIIGSFVACWEDLKFVFNNITDIGSAAFYGILNVAIRVINFIGEKWAAFVNTMATPLNLMAGVLGYDPIVSVNWTPIEEFANEAADRLTGAVRDRNAAVQEALTYDYLSAMGGAIQTASEWAASQLRGFAAGIGGGSEADRASRSRGGGGKTDAEKFAEIIAGATATIATLREEQAAIGLVGRAAAYAARESELFNEARQAGLRLTPVQIAQLRELAGVMADLDEQNRTMQFMVDQRAAHQQQMNQLDAEIAGLGLVGRAAAVARREMQLLNEARAANITLTEADRADIAARAAEGAGRDTALSSGQSRASQTATMQEAIANLEAERNAIGLTAAAADALRYEQQLLNDARFRGIELTPAEIEALQMLRAEQFALQEGINRTREAINFAKSATRSFFQDMQNGLNQGKSIWSAFGDAVVGVIDRILQRFLDAQIDQMFASMSGGGSAGGGGSGILSFLGFAKGGVFDGNGLTGFTKGGAFTNSIVQSPTAFSYGNGQLGQMGEAGPEAVMPLSRGPDGSLGVKMHNGMMGGNNRTMNNHVTVNNNYRLSGAISSDDVIAMNRAAAERTKDDVRRNLNGWLGELQRDGGMV